MEEKRKNSLPLHTCHVDITRAALNRLHMTLHAVLLLWWFSYRASHLFSATPHHYSYSILLAFTFASELGLAFLWLLSRAFRWRPVTRAAYPEQLPDGDGELPAIDVFICTADPEKEPPVDVMGTVLSAMGLDYPPEKLTVYLSDDAGAEITLWALRQAFSFAKQWLPFCRKYGVRTRCPDAFFSQAQDCRMDTVDFSNDREKMKLRYEAFKEKIERAEEKGLVRDKNSKQRSKGDRPSLVEVICDEAICTIEDHEEKMPRLVYVSREKKSNHPHHFKAGALNVLFRVSSLLSNAPYVLVLDCDMYCNDPISAKAAMCFLLDPLISPSLAFVQFPQVFHNISRNDIYANQLREVFKVTWKGCDGLGGPILSGTNFYIKREALYGAKPGYAVKEGLDSSDDFTQRRKCFGPSNVLIKKLRPDYKCNVEEGVPSKEVLQEALLLASCSYENDTEWGKQIGFLYDSVVEDFVTGFRLHCRGWKSIYYNPQRPQFLGSAPSNLNTALVQYKRWMSGLLEAALSMLSPLACGMNSGHSILHTMCYGHLAFTPLYAPFVLWHVSVPQLCLLNGISLYPKVSDPWFVVYAFILISCSSHHLWEVLSTGGSVNIWWNEQRIWMVKVVSSYFFGCLDACMKLIGTTRVDFELTNKALDKDRVDRYERGEFDFQDTSKILVPAVTVSILNMVTFIGGILRMIVKGSFNELFPQLSLTFFTLINCYPILEGIIRTDSGRIPTSITSSSVICTMVLLFLGCILFTM